MAWVTPPTFTALGAATAAMFNKLRDCLNAIGDAWATYTPSVTAATSNPTQGSSTYSGRYRNAGKTWDVKIMLTIGAGWAAGTGNYRVSLPPGLTPLAVASGEILGQANFFDVSTGATYAFNVYMFSSSAVSLVNATTGVVGSASPVVPTVGDRISMIILCLEAA